MPAPFVPQTVTITDHFTDGGGAPLDGRAVFRPSATSKTPDATITRNPITAKITGGNLSVVLIASDSTGVTPQGWTYEVALTLGPPGSLGAEGIDAFGYERWNIRPVAANPAVVLRDLVHVDPVPDSHFQVRSVAGVFPGVDGNIALTATDLEMAGVGFMPAPPVGENLDTWLTAFGTHVTSGQTYSDPSGGDVTNFLLGFAAIARGDTTSSLLTALGFTIQIGYETITKRKYALIYNEYGTARAWGAYLIDLTTPRFTGLIQAPHTVFDGVSEFMALQSWRDHPGTLLMISGSHRTDTTGTNPRDGAHNTSSLFHQVALKYLAYGLPQLSHHGYADATDASHDVIVSSGAANAGLAIRRVADCLEAAGLRTARSWVDTGNVLLGTTDVQGIAAQTAGTPFCHIEVNNTVRTTPALLAKYKAALASANYFGTVDTAWAPLALAVTGQFPSAVGSVNSVGSSPYWPRVDHVHRLTSDTPVDGNVVMRVAGAWTSQTPAQTKTALALDQVNNTTDAGKPVSTAQATAIGLKADSSLIGAASGIAPLNSSTKVSSTYISFGSTSTTVTRGDDARLSDARTPLAHTHVIADTTGLQTALDDLVATTLDSGTLGDLVSSVPRYAASSQDTLSNGFTTIIGALATRSSVSVTKLRFHVRGAVGSPGIVTLAVYKGTNRASLTKVVADTTVTTQFGSTGPKEITVSSFSIAKGDWLYLSLLHTNAGTDPIISTLPGPPSADLINPTAAQTIYGFKGSQSLPLATTLDVSASFTASGRIAWFAMAA